MNMREQFEALRGCAINLRANAADVPCIETSDEDRLCKNPVVSIWMITYNHEPYIRQALDSVLMQKTDFEFEIVIGEDASQDKTREICFEYQRRYPEKVRVLWSEKNEYANGGNSARVDARCRGEFIAILEGDDYWMDSRRLQKQVDVMRKYPNVVLCFGEKQDYIQATGEIRAIHSVANQYRAGLIPKEVFVQSSCTVPPFTSMIRKSAQDAMYKRFEIFSWRLALGDLQRWRGLSAFGDVYVFHDLFATYRVHEGGVMHTMPIQIAIDAGIVRMYFSRILPNTPLRYYEIGLHSLVVNQCRQIAHVKGMRTRVGMLQKLFLACPSESRGIDQVGILGCLLVVMGCDIAMFRRLRDGVRRRVDACIMKILAGIAK